MWSFKEFQTGEIIHNSHEEEFFKEQVPLGSVIREAIQNSLDAAIPGNEPVKVRFLYGRASQTAGRIFTGLKEHLISSDIRATELGNTGFEFLAIEDFNTTGLTGTTSYLRCATEGEGNFCNFWWVDGSTRKGMTKGGRWGIGKYSFFVFSKIKVFFGISLPEFGEGPFLMGRALLVRHSLNGRNYHPEGIYASNGSEPIRESSLIQFFKTNFDLERGTETGLSIVVPYPELDDCSSVLNEIIYHVLANYLYSLLDEKLIVSVEDRTTPQKREMLVKRDSLYTILRNLSKTDARCAEFERTYHLYTKILSANPDFVLSLGDEDLPSINEDSFKGKIEDAKKKYIEGNNSVIKIRVPFRLRLKDPEEVRETYVDISLSADPTFKNEPVHCIRSGIKVINGVHDFKMESGVVVLIAQDEAACEFLGDSENPSHTDWISRTERLRRGRFLSADKVLKFIKSLPGCIVRLLSENRESEYAYALADVFFVKELGEQTKRGSRESHTPLVPAISTFKNFQVKSRESGFSVTLLKTYTGNLPKILTIKTAYDTAEGNPFRKYSPFDYRIGSDSVVIEEINGGELIEASDNIIKVMVERQDFAITVKGFDPRRDLIVNIKSAEAESE